MLPALTAIEEGSVEPSPSAVRALLRTLSHPPAYPVGIDTSGRVADGYEVEGQPWFVLTSPPAISCGTGTWTLQSYAR